MKDFFEDLHEDNEQEPSFSFHDFKKWLTKQKKNEEVEPDDGLEEFKARVKRKKKKKD